MSAARVLRRRIERTQVSYGRSNKRYRWFFARGERGLVISTSPASIAGLR